MKKIAILTSLLALTACGGGGHGGSDRYVDPVEQSNLAVTGMVSNSEYQVARYVANKLGEDAESVNLARTAFVRNPATGNVDYDIARELVDLAAWLAKDTTTADEIVTMFNTSAADKNKIKAALKLLDDMYCFVGGSAEKTAERIISRRAEFVNPLNELQQRTEVFNLEDVDFSIADEGFGGKMKFKVNERTGEVDKFIILADEDDEDDTDSVFVRDGKTNKFVGDVRLEELVSAKLAYDSFGKKLGLKYSDFGTLDIDVIPNWRPVFIGGYDSKKIEPNDIATNAIFTGKATGSVVAIHDGEGSGRALPLDADAKLTFDKTTGNSELVAKFANWYDMKYTENGTQKTIALENYKNSDNDFRMLSDAGEGVTMDNRVQHEYDFRDNIDMDEHSTIESLHASANDEDLDLIMSDLRYFGNENVPTESVGMIQVRECADNRCGDVITEITPENKIEMRRNDEVRVNVAFGAN